mmetsp:Transcript_43400/g.114347  ORF Transcript_43400/g.114347 Transcript_43400/m.114347 type:complete len:204 (+) Transcript_43400:1188-1799(+)
MSGTLSRVALPLTTSLCSIDMGSATTPPSPTGWSTIVATVMPPVRAPMRRWSATASNSEVPVSKRRRENKGTRGTSSSGKPFSSNNTSAYTTPAHGSGWVNSTPPPGRIASVVGISLILCSRSCRPTRGMVARSSGLSSFNCASFRSTVARITVSTSASDMDAFADANLCSSCACCFAASSASGCSSIVDRCRLSTMQRLSKD